MEQKKLVKLDLSKNRIELIEEGAFSGLHSLKSLDLSQNELTDISSRNWPYLAELENLDLSSNRFGSIYAGFFEGLASLRMLNLERNEDLERVELNAFAGLQKLDTLKLRNCPHLSFIDEYAFEHPNQLRQVHLSNNALSKISSNLLNWRQITKLELSGNPWNCDCELLRFLPDIIKDLQEKKSMNRVESRPICTFPEEVSGLSIDSVPAPSCSPLTENAMLSLIIAGTVVFLLTVLIIVACLQSKSCCSSSNKEKNLSRAPLYTGGSSFTDSLTYDKTDPMMVHRQSTLPIIKQSHHYPHENHQHDYYSQILLLPPNSGTLPPNCLSYAYCDDASPYATGNVIRSDYRMRPPSWVAPPPPPPTLPPPPLNYKMDPHQPVPSTEL